MRNEPFSTILKIFSSNNQLMVNPHRFGNAESSSTVDHAQLILIVDNQSFVIPAPCIGREQTQVLYLLLC